MNNDLISRKALLDALSNNMVVARGVPKYEWTWVVRVKENIIRVIKELSVADVGPSKQDWISVKDRLPEQYAVVIVYDGEQVGEAEFNGVDFGWVESEDLAFATHWMPLPEPPKEGDLDE